MSVYKTRRVPTVGGGQKGVVAWMAFVAHISAALWSLDSDIAGMSFRIYDLFLGYTGRVITRTVLKNLYIHIRIRSLEYEGV